MLKIYITSVLIWMIILWSAVALFAPSIQKNGWLDAAGNDNNIVRHPVAYLFVCAAVPFFRLLLLSAMVTMSGMTKESYEKIQHRKEDE